MSVPDPPSEHGNVVEPDVFAARRARRAEVSEDAGLELQLFEAERRLAEVVLERDGLRAQIEAEERELRTLRQREWSEQQQRLEAQGEAAVTREVAAEQVASLRARLAAVETELAVVTEERDRARAELARERAAARSDRELRVALEAEHAALREEVERRGRLALRAADAVSAARHEVEASRRSGAWAARDLERRLVEERGAFAARVEAVEAAVAAVRERFGAAARVLRERFEAERGARVAAERALASAQAHIASLEAELAAVRAGDAERLASLSARVESVSAAAARVREDADAELRGAVAAMQARVAELQAAVAAAAGVREELDAERAARWVAEAELDAERRRGADERAARAAAEARLVEVQAELAALRAPGRPDEATLASLRDALAGLRAAEPAAPAPAALAVDLAAAAERLRSAVEAEPVLAALADVPAPEPAAADHASKDDNVAHMSSLDEVEAALVELSGQSEPAPLASKDDVAPEEGAVSSLDDAEPAEPAEHEAAEQPAPAAQDVAPAAPARSSLPERGPIIQPGPWLRDALVALAGEEPEIAELLLVALLPAQAGLAKKPLTYDIAIAGGATHRVALDADRARVELPSGAPAEIRVTGPLAALVPLATGGAGRRLPGAHVEGRRHLRRLLKARRAPLGLAELAAAGVTLSPGLLLTVLARAVEPRWTAGRSLTVDIAPEGADRWRVASHSGGPLSILPAGDAEPAPATLHTAPGRLPAVLAAVAAPDDAYVEGDVRAVRTLLTWLDRAQRGRAA